jgi:hypothetical protein
MARAHDLTEITRTLSAPLGELIAAVGRGVAEAQWALDMHTVESFKAIHGSDDATYRALRDLGYQPTWYRIPEVSAEIYVTMSASGEERSAGIVPAGAQASSTSVTDVAVGRIELYATPVDASFSNTYDYQLRACSQLKFRIVPVPAPGLADGMRPVPAFAAGTTLKDARALLDREGIAYRIADHGYYEPSGDEVIAETTPAAGEMLRSGATLVLKLAI